MYRLQTLPAPYFQCPTDSWSCLVNLALPFAQFLTRCIVFDPRLRCPAVKEEPPDFIGLHSYSQVEQHALAASSPADFTGFVHRRLRLTLGGLWPESLMNFLAHLAPLPALA
jgi:hypothetical protein